MPAIRKFSKAIVFGIAIASVFLFGTCAGTRQGLMGYDITTLPILTNADSRAITMENPTGGRGIGGQAAGGRKGSPARRNLGPGEEHVLVDIEGTGVIKHIWLTTRVNPKHMRTMVIRMWWDNEEHPSVEVPLLDFFGQAHGLQRPMDSALTSVAEGRGFNCYFLMPFETGARISITNEGDDNVGALFYQVDYDLLPKLPKNCGRFHAQWRRQNPTVEKQDYVILDNVNRPGVFIGMVLGIRFFEPHWWGEGEVKVYFEGDDQYPTICGTGTEDYFGSAWGIGEFQTQYLGCTLHRSPYVSMYRWHITDPIRFKELRKLTIQQLKWDRGVKETVQDVCSTAFWYQEEPHTPFPSLIGVEKRIAHLAAKELLEKKE